MTQTLLILLSVTFISMLSPGPDMLLLIKNSCSGSRRIALSCVVGITASISFHVTLAVLGLAAVISTSVILFSFIRYAGSCYLIYIGWKSFKNARKTSLLHSEEAPAVSASSAFREGFFCNLLNPKFTIYLLSIFSHFIGPDTSAIERMIYGSAIILEGIVVWSLFVLFLQFNAVQIALNNFQVPVNRLIGGILISFGIAVAIND